MIIIQNDYFKKGMHSPDPSKKGLAHNRSFNYYFLILKGKQRLNHSLIFFKKKMCRLQLKNPVTRWLLKNRGNDIFWLKL